MSNPAPLTHDELKQVFTAYFFAVNSAPILEASYVRQALTERTALLSGIARACATSSDNPHANTVAQKLLREVELQYPDIDSRVIASILSQAFTEATRLCTPTPSSLIGTEARNTLEDELRENHVRILELYLRTLDFRQS